MRSRTRIFLSALPALPFATDRLLKWRALGGLHWPAWPGVFVFDLFRNTGIAFSLPFSGPAVWLLSAGILILVGIKAAHDLHKKRYARAEAYGLFILGACSNLFDRVAYGFTVDYFIFFSRSAVNIADGMIVGGALWLLLAADRDCPRP